MRCAHCDTDEDRVIDSRPVDEGRGIRRRRECLACGRRTTTYERVEVEQLRVRKRDGRSEPFDRTKIAAGCRAAAKYRPVTDERLDQLAREIETAMRRLGVEVATATIGDAVLAALADLDGVTYVRFASVVKGFEDVADFEAEASALAAAEIADGVLLRVSA